MLSNMIYKTGVILAGALLIMSCAANYKGLFEYQDNPLSGKIICIDPGHGGTAAKDSFRIGPTGEREEWIDLRVALILRDLLEDSGAKVLMTRTDDSSIPLKERAMLAVNNNADVFISIHHNATADRSVNFPIIYFHGNATENRASVELAKIFAEEISAALFNSNTPVTIASDHVIFPGSGTSVLRNSYGIPGIIGEASFFSNADEEQRLKNPEYNKREAEAYFKTLERYFSKKEKLYILPKYSILKIPPLEVLKESDRMDDTAKQWKENFEQGKELVKKGDAELIQKGYELLTLSVTSFPDSPVARECHTLRAGALDKLGKTAEAEIERHRAEEFYVMK